MTREEAIEILLIEESGAANWPEPPMDLIDALDLARRDVEAMKTLEGYSTNWPRCTDCGYTLEAFHEYDDSSPTWSCPDCGRKFKVSQISYFKMVD